VLSLLGLRRQLARRAGHAEMVHHPPDDLLPAWTRCG
jgi:hypothetical protein